MTFRDYIGVIDKAGICTGSQTDIVADLYEAAGAVDIVDTEAAKGWLRPMYTDGYRRCKIKKYFPSGKVDEYGFILFFSSRKSWRKLQETFRHYPYETDQPQDEDFLIDVGTDTPKIFYRSLLNQFQRIHRLQETGDPEEMMLMAFNQAYRDCRLYDFTFDYSTGTFGEGSLDTADNFFNIMDTTIAQPYKLNHYETPVYQKIKEFCSELWLVIQLLPTAITPQSPCREELEYRSMRVHSLYQELNKNNTAPSPGMRLNPYPHNE